jgi:hypothetical protein
MRGKKAENLDTRLNYLEFPAQFEVKNGLTRSEHLPVNRFENVREMRRNFADTSTEALLSGGGDPHRPVYDVDDVSFEIDTAEYAYDANGC